MFYKIYFWFYLAFAGLMLLSLSKFANIWFLILIALESILLIALFSNAYKKDFFSMIFWKISFFYAILIGTLSILFDFIHAVNTSTKSNLTISLVVVTGLTLLSMPAYISLYAYVFKKRKVSFKFKVNKQKLWKIYYYFILINIILSYIILAKNFRIWELLDLPFTIFAIIGLHAFVWGKYIISKNFWKFFAFVSLMWNIYYFYIIPIPSDLAVEGISQFSAAIFSTILYTPMTIAIFLYAFQKKIN